MKNLVWNRSAYIIAHFQLLLLNRDEIAGGYMLRFMGGVMVGHHYPRQLVLVSQNTM